MATGFSSFTLNHGVQLYVQPTRKFKTTVIYIYFHLPLRSDLVTCNALLPMVLARGSGEYPSTAALARRFDELYGASFGYEISRRGEVHSLVFRLEVAGEQHIPGDERLLQGGLETLAGMILRPLVEGDGFKPDYVAQEAANLKQTIESLINDKRRWAMVRCTEAMCKDEPFALYRLGRMEDLAGITPQVLLAHHRYVLSNAPVDIFVIGDLDPEATKAQIARAFTLPPAADDGRQMPSTHVVRKPEGPIQVVEERLKVNQGLLVIGLRTGLTIRDEEYFPMLVANGVLGGFGHSKLFQEVREKHSLAYYAYSAVETVKGVGFMHAGIEFEDMQTCKEIMLAQLKAVQEGQITDEELETTIEALASDMLSAADNPGAMADLAVDRLFSGHELSIEDRIAAYRAVTKEQVAAAANKFAVDTVYFLNKQEGGE